ncbi:MAG: DUF2202 domain-containing protein [Tissierellia bacterium]|nr:DUF2202 domain-containing protein [Tissierellia bacterium]
MKNISKLLVVSMLALSMVIGMGIPAYAVSNEVVMDLLEEEMTAEHLYSELYKKYPENILFSRLSQSENRHLNALKRAMNNLNISTEDAKIANIEIPNTKEGALEFALAYEKEDIDYLEKLLPTVEEKNLERVLSNLLRGSQQHKETLERAIETGIDNLNCNEQRNYNNGGSKNEQAFNNENKGMYNMRNLQDCESCTNDGVRIQYNQNLQNNKSIGNRRGNI